MITNDLIQYIERGSSNDVERAARVLARSRANIQFSLINDNDNEENRTAPKRSEAGASYRVLQLVYMI